MLPSQPPKVLILAREVQSAHAWAEHLAATSATVWFSAADSPRHDEVEVVLSDMPADEAISASTPQGQRLAELRSQGRLVVVGIGGVAGADLPLAAPWTPGELRLACQLAGEIVRLRIARDEISQSHQHVTQLAETDALTGVANRRAWDRSLESLTLGESAPRTPRWLAIVDLDRFKEVNDRLGYAAGDRLLHAAALAMAEQLRREDLIARIGGDEFGVMLSGINEHQARAVFERLREAVSRQSAEGREGRITASLGFSGSHSPTSSAELLAAAEGSLRKAKREGGDRIVGGPLRAEK
jgi:diguanylate cyclase (GGDEF)-like protein